MMVSSPFHEERYPLFSCLLAHDHSTPTSASTVGLCHREACPQLINLDLSVFWCSYH